jgi:glycosyltransferase involved in cell wall biosynthesis
VRRHRSVPRDVPLRVAFVTNAWTKRGGAERVLYTLLGALDQGRCQPVVFSIFDPKGEATYCKAAQALGIPVVCLRLTPTWSPKFLREAARLFSAIWNGRFQALHASGDMGVGLLFGYLAGVPVRLITVHDVALDRRRIDYWSRLVSVRCLATTSVAVSAAVARSIRDYYGVPASRTQTIPNGVDDWFVTRESADGRVLSGALPHRPSILTVSRLAPEKGIDVLLRAAADLVAGGAEFELNIVGDGPARDDLVSLAQELGVYPVTKFHGQRQDVARFLRDADIFVLPSRSEGLGIAAIEAMSASLPVVASAVGGIPEVVVDGVTGSLIQSEGPAGVSAEPDSHSMAKAMLHLLRNQELARAMGEAGRRRYEECFTAASFARSYEDLYIAGRNGE